MSVHATRPRLGSPPADSPLRTVARELTAYWFVWLAAGIAWVVVSLVVLQFDHASVTTVGVLIGVMFAFAGIQTISLATLPRHLRWVPKAFGTLFLIAAVICFVNPEDTFAGVADVLGFLFVIVGVWWMVRAFLESPVNPLWWLGLIGGMLMTILAFWTAGQFFIARSYVLLVFAGIWALMEGIADIVRALALRRLHEVV